MSAQHADLPSEASSFESMQSSIASLAQEAELRGDHFSANILINVALLLAEVRSTRPPEKGAQGGDASATKAGSGRPPLTLV